MKSVYFGCSGNRLVWRIVVMTVPTIKRNLGLGLFLCHTLFERNVHLYTYMFNCLSGCQLHLTVFLNSAPLNASENRGFWAE